MHVEGLDMPGVRMRYAVLLMVSATACTQAELYIDQSALPTRIRQSSDALVCTPPSASAEPPYKLLFVIDTSGSNATTDSGTPPRRERAVRDAINATIDNASFSYGVITFSDQPVQQTFGFTRDTTVLAGALQNIASAQGGTNYSNTLWTAIDFIANDLDALSVTEAARTHYIIYWLSDGYPTVGVTEAAAITPGVTKMCTSVGPRVAEIAFNTAFLGSGATSPMEAAAAVSLLSAMADECPGAFINIPNGSAIAFDIDTDPVVTQYQLALYVATNTNVHLGQYEPEPDSDGDGLIDSEEQRLGTKADNPDTDDDGVRDGVEQRLAPLRSPLTVESRCGALGVDTDDDGLYDCEEAVLGTSPNAIDTDGDLLPDGLETLTGGEPLRNDPTADADLDGYPDALETRAHMPTESADDTERAVAWSYQYALAPSAVPAGISAGADTACYALSVTNMTLRETRPTRAHDAGENVIEVWAVFQSLNLSSEPLFYRVRRTLTVLEPDIVDPPQGVIKLAPTDFERVGGQ